MVAPLRAQDQLLEDNTCHSLSLDAPDRMHIAPAGSLLAVLVAAAEQDKGNDRQAKPALPT